MAFAPMRKREFDNVFRLHMRNGRLLQILHEVFKMAEEKGQSGVRRARKRESSGDNQPVQNGIDNEPDFSDDEDYVDDISDDGSVIDSQSFRYILS